MSQGFVTEGYSSTIGNKRSHGDDFEKPSKRPFDGMPLLKILVPNFFAGDIIGKKGVKRMELESEYNCKIRFSPNKQAYPGTDQRVIAFSGDLDDIKSFHNFVIDKLNTDAFSDPKYADSEHNKSKLVVKILCPSLCAGLIIGNGGADIKALQEETKAKVVVGRREDSKVPFERIVSITGELDNRIDAANRVADIIAAHAENIKLGYNLDYSSEGMDSGMGNHPGNFPNNFQGSNPPMNNNFNNGPSQGMGGGNPPMNNNFNNGPSQGMGGGNFTSTGPFGPPNGGSYGGAAQNISDFNGNFQNNSQFETNVTIKMKIPEALVGVLMGNDCQVLKQVIDYSGCQVDLTPSNGYQQPRILTLEGDINQTKTAKTMVNQKLKTAINEMNQTC